MWQLFLKAWNLSLIVESSKTAKVYTGGRLYQFISLELKEFWISQSTLYETWVFFFKCLQLSVVFEWRECVVPDTLKILKLAVPNGWMMFVVQRAKGIYVFHYFTEECSFFIHWDWELLYNTDLVSLDFY